MLVQHLFTVRAVEAFDVGILIGFAGLDVLNGHSGPFGPGGERLAQKFRSVVAPHDLRQTVFRL